MKKILIAICGLTSLASSFAQQKSGTIKASLVAVYADMPHPSSVPKSTHTLDPVIEAYQQRLERLSKDMAETYLKYNDTYQTYLQEGETGLQKKAAQQADQNEILAQMGGAEKVAKMNTADAQAAAITAYQKKMQTPAASIGPAATTNMNGLMQNMLKDPKLRARFEKMSEQEKQTFLEAYIAKEIPRNDAQYEKTIAQKNRLNHYQNTIQELAAIQQEAMNIGSYYSQQTEQLNATLARKRDSLQKWYNAAYAAIPMVVEGEGRWKDSKQSIPLNEKYNQELDKLNQKETLTRITYWQEHYVKIKPVLVRFEEAYVANHQLGIHHDIDQQIASVAGQFIEMMKAMTASADTLTPRKQEK